MKALSDFSILHETVILLENVDNTLVSETTMVSGQAARLLAYERATLKTELPIPLR